MPIYVWRCSSFVTTSLSKEYGVTVSSEIMAVHICKCSSNQQANESLPVPLRWVLNGKALAGKAFHFADAPEKRLWEAPDPQLPLSGRNPGPVRSPPRLFGTRSPARLRAARLRLAAPRRRLLVPAARRLRVEAQLEDPQDGHDQDHQYHHGHRHQDEDVVGGGEGRRGGRPPAAGGQGGGRPRGAAGCGSGEAAVGRGAGRGAGGRGAALFAGAVELLRALPGEAARTVPAAEQHLPAWARHGQLGARRAEAGRGAALPEGEAVVEAQRAVGAKLRAGVLLAVTAGVALALPLAGQLPPAPARAVGTGQVQPGAAGGGAGPHGLFRPAAERRRHLPRGRLVAFLPGEASERLSRVGAGGGVPLQPDQEERGPRGHLGQQRQQHPKVRLCAHPSQAAPPAAAGSAGLVVRGVGQVGAEAGAGGLAAHDGGRRGPIQGADRGQEQAAEPGPPPPHPRSGPGDSGCLLGCVGARPGPGPPHPSAGPVPAALPRDYAGGSVARAGPDPGILRLLAARPRLAGLQRSGGVGGKSRCPPRPS